MHIPPTISENLSAVAGSSGVNAPATTPPAGLPSFASFLSPREKAAVQPRAAAPIPGGPSPGASVPPGRMPAAVEQASPPGGPPSAAEKAPAAGKGTDERPTGKSAKKSQEHTLSSAICLALLGLSMPVTPEPVASRSPLDAAEPPRGNGTADVPPAAPPSGTGTAPLAVAASQIGVPQSDVAPGGVAPFGGPGTAATDSGVPGQPARLLAEAGSSGLPAGAVSPGAVATSPGAAAPRATADVLAKLGITPSPASAVAPKSPVSAKSLPPTERSASVAGLAAESPRSDAAPKSDKVSELLIRPTGAFARRPESDGTGTAQPPAMFHDTQALRSDAVATSVFHAASVPDVAADPSAGAAAPADVHAAIGHAVEAVSVAVEHAARDRNSVKLDFDIAGERVAVVVERHADEIRATFKADSAELREALSQQWQASTADRATSTVQPVFTNHASSHHLPDSQSRGFARQENSPHQSGEHSARGDVPRRRGAAAAPAAVSTTPLSSRLPAFRHGSSLHLSTLA